MQGNIQLKFILCYREENNIITTRTLYSTHWVSALLIASILPFSCFCLVMGSATSWDSDRLRALQDVPVEAFWVTHNRKGVCAWQKEKCVKQWGEGRLQNCPGLAPLPSTQPHKIQHSEYQRFTQQTAVIDTDNGGVFARQSDLLLRNSSDLSLHLSSLNVVTCFDLIIILPPEYRGFAVLSFYFVLDLMMSSELVNWQWICKVKHDNVPTLQ